MIYKIPEQDKESLSFFVPVWFTEAILSGKSHDVLKKKIIDEIHTSYSLLAEENMPIDIEDKAVELFETYMGALDDYKEV